jgi:hypothetical protein
VLVPSEGSLGTSVASSSDAQLLSEVHSLLVSVGGVSGGGVPSSAYAIVGLMALKNKTAMITNERKDERVLPVIDPPSKPINILIHILS